METTSAHSTTKTESPSKAAVWTGRIISGLCIAFFLFDALGKIFLESHSVSGTTALGFTENVIQPFGFTLLICTILYTIPKTAIIGAVLITGYLGGATATMVHASMPVYFSLGLGVLTWAGLYLRDARTRSIFSIN